MATEASPSVEARPAHQTIEEFKEVVRRVEGPYVHALIFRFWDEASPETVDTALQMATELGDLPGVVAWSIRESLDERKGRRALELGVFENGQAYLNFRDHPRHNEFSSYLSRIADWDIVDFTPASVVQEPGAFGLLGAANGQPAEQP